MKDIILNNINNRDLASLFWLIMICIFIMIMSYKNNKIQDIFISLKGVVIALFYYKLLILFLILFLNTLCSIFFLKLINLWDLSQLKNTIIWFLFTGLVSIAHAVNSKDYNGLFRSTVFENFKLLFFLEFYINLQAFSIIIEIILVGITTILLMLSIPTTEHAKTHKFFNNILTIIGFILFCVTTYNVLTNPQNFFNYSKFLDLITPINLTLLSLPSIFIILLISSYEKFFVSYNRQLKNSDEASSIKATIIKRINIKVDILNKLREVATVKKILTLSEMNNTIDLIEMHHKIRKNPPNVPLQLGWSPYLASDYLISYGIKCNLYKSIYDDKEWFTHSNSYRPQSLLSHITYYIQGNEREVTRLCLKLNLVDLSEKALSLNHFCKLVEQLYRKATQSEIDEVIISKILELSHLIKNFEHFSVIVESQHHKYGVGYLISFTIKNHHHIEFN